MSRRPSSARGRPRAWTRKVKLSQLAQAEREVGELIEFGDARWYTVVRINKREGAAYLLRVGPME